MPRTTQITIRLPEDQVEFLDDQIRKGVYRSRAAGVSRALLRLQREVQAERDVLIMMRQPYDEFDDMHKWAAAHPLKLDD